MKKQREYTKVVVNNKQRDRIHQGHPWVYDEEVVEIIGDYENGDIVDVFSTKDKYLGSGFINDVSKILVRIFSKNANDVFNDSFFLRRLEHSYAYRKTVMGDDIDDCRLIFGEADYFPGLTMDRFHDLLVVQILSLGIEKRKDLLLQGIYDILRKDGQDIQGIFIRNDVSLRKKEGMDEYVGWYEKLPHPASPVTYITENNIKYKVDVENGQKTGFFLDQKYNRKSIHNVAKGKTVLDCFSHTGSFALNAAIAGAKSVTAVDISELAMEFAHDNAVMNGLDEHMEFVVADVFEYLKEIHKNQYDFIILDPPAFTKSRKTIPNAYKGYKEINKMAMQKLPRGGYLATCSCSHFMSEGLFKQMLNEASSEAGVALRQIEVRQQACDHPILWNVPETNYLKFFIFQIA